jgi:hypothetical protein
MFLDEPLPIRFFNPFRTILNSLLHIPCWLIKMPSQVSMLIIP